MEKNYLIAFGLTLFAGLATIFGGSLSFVLKKTNLRALGVGLGFSAGVMVYLALTEILKDSQEFSAFYFGDNARLITLVGFFVGAIIAASVDYLLPTHVGSDMINKDPEEITEQDYKVNKAGILTAMAICLHRFPEGLTMFLVASTNIKIGVPLAIALAIHNMPEGIAISLPIYHSTGKKRIAMLFTFLASLAGPIGAVIGFILIKMFMPQMAIGILFSIVAGIMVYISLDTLMPLAREYGENHDVMIGIFSGMLFIGIGLMFI
jgi:ZIP family zinc transporter